LFETPTSVIGSSGLAFFWITKRCLIDHDMTVRFGLGGDKCDETTIGDFSLKMALFG
jgi:hypothetical protein